MDKKEIINIYKKKLNDLKDHNRSYFSKDKPKISDHEYDSLKKDVLKLENNYPYLKKFGTVGNIVGSPPSNKFKKIKHLKPMLSLSNAFDKKDMEDFIKKINNFLNFEKKDIEFF